MPALHSHGASVRRQTTRIASNAPVPSGTDSIVTKSTTATPGPDQAIRTRVAVERYRRHDRLHVRDGPWVSRVRRYGVGVVAVVDVGAAVGTGAEVDVGAVVGIGAEVDVGAEVGAGADVEVGKAVEVVAG